MHTFPNLGGTRPEPKIVVSIATNKGGGVSALLTNRGNSMATGLPFFVPSQPFNPIAAIRRAYRLGREHRVPVLVRLDAHTNWQSEWTEAELPSSPS